MHMLGKSDENECSMKGQSEDYKSLKVEDVEEFAYCN